MLKTKIKLSNEQLRLINNSLKSNFNNIRFIQGFNYQEFLPNSLRKFIRRLIGFSNFSQKELLYDFEKSNLIDLNMEPSESIWPNNKKCAFISTHDIDSAFGQEYIESFFNIEKKLNIRSTNFWVTNLYKLNHDLLKSAFEAGFEIGLHDYNHDGRLAMLKKEEIKKRIDLSKDFITEYSVTGIRSPGFLRSVNFYSAIKDLFNYDMSIVDYSFLFPFSGDGCRTSLPLYLNNLLLIPNSLIRDGEALALGLKTKEIFNVWLKKYEWLKSKKSLSVLLTHPDKEFSGSKEMLSVYKDFLEYVANDNECWITTAKDLSNHMNKKKEDLIYLTLEKVEESFD